MREDNKLLSITGSGAGQSWFEAELGFDKFIEDCLTEEASIYGFDEEKKETQPIHQRKLIIGKPYRREVSKID
jgi:hypothetical protein